MLESQAFHIFEFILGALILATVFLRLWAEQLGVPSLLGFLFLGFLVRLLDTGIPFLSQVSLHILEFLGDIGIFILLFRVGLDSNLHGLVSKLPRAAPIWVGNVVLSGVPAYFVCSWLLALDLVPSLFVAVALTATSIAISTELWQEAGALNSDEGEILLDVAEMDDLSGVALLALVIAIAPALQFGSDSSLVSIVTATGLIFVGKALLFGVLCAVIARYGEKRIVTLLRIAGEPTSALVLIGIGLVISAIASLLGLSIAIGAFFAGLIFSRDPETVRAETAFVPLQDFFVPFFFIIIGFHIAPQSLAAGIGIGGILLVVAVFGKIAGAGLPALFVTSASGALLIGVSMVPRAEIAMVISQQARGLGDWAMPTEVYSAIAVVSLATCILTPLVVRALLKREDK